MKEQFRQYLIDEGYRKETPSGYPSTVDDYVKRIDRISTFYKLKKDTYSIRDIQELQRIKTKLDRGGINEAFGDGSHRAVYNAMAGYCEFFENYNRL